MREMARMLDGVIMAARDNRFKVAKIRLGFRLFAQFKLEWKDYFESEAVQNKTCCVFNGVSIEEKYDGEGIEIIMEAK